MSIYRKLARDEVFGRGDRALDAHWPDAGLPSGPANIVPIMVIGADRKVRFRNTERHRAAYRCASVAWFVENVVLTHPNARPELYVGEYRFEPHDSPDVGREEPTLAFARDLLDASRSRNVVLVPDQYQLFGYQGQFDMYVDDVPWSQKAPTVMFVGTTTGPEDPALNKRVQAAIGGAAPKSPAGGVPPPDPLHDGKSGSDRVSVQKSKQKSSNHTDHRVRGSGGGTPSAGDLGAAPPKIWFKLSSVRQMTEQALERYLLTKGMTLKDVMSDFVEPSAHKMYRYILNIEGNTCCWSRVPMVMRSKSLMINLKHNEGTWYYPALCAGKHFVEIDRIEDVLEARAWCEDHPDACQEMVDEANKFYEQFCTQRAAAIYVVELLEAIAEYRGLFRKRQQQNVVDRKPRKIL